MDYADWFAWCEKRAAQLATTAPVHALGMIADLAEIVQGDVDLFSSLTKAAGGGFLGIAVGLASWAAKHPDPLKPSRERMRAMRVKYGEVVHGQ